MTPRRARHSEKDVEQALRFAEANGWIVRPTASGHRWGEMTCGHVGPDPCRISIWSTPKTAGTTRTVCDERCETVLSRPRSESEGGPVALFSFTLTVERADILTDDAINALYEAGCDDATFGVSGGVQTGEFDREATDFAEAVASAIKAVEAAVPGALVVDVHRELEAAAAG